MEIRQAFPNEIGAIMTVIESARIALAEAGSSQWQGAYDVNIDIFSPLCFISIMRCVVTLRVSSEI